MLSVLIMIFLSLVLTGPPARAAPTSIQNPSLEQSTGGIPTCFARSGWGNNTPTWTITTDAHTGSAAQSLTVANYVSGDRKLMMSETATCAPAVIPGKAYTLGAWYKSTSAKNTLTVFRHTATGWTYWTDLTAKPAANTWTQISAQTPAVPAGTDQITFGIALASNGTLITDDYTFAEVGSVQPPPSGELTTNGTLEAGGNPPTGWMVSGWGTSTVSSGITNTAHGGTRAYQITLSGRTSGDYKLLPTEASSPGVQPGNIYTLSAWYTSTAVSNSMTIFQHTSTGWSYWTDIKALPATTTWSQATAVTPPIPAGVDAIAWGISISSDGTLTTDDYSTTQQSAPAVGAATVGSWTVLTDPMPIRTVHSTLLNNGQVLLIAGSGNSVDQFTAGSFKAAVWDPVTAQFSVLTVPKDMFCAGHVTLPDGRVLIQGGTKSYPGVNGAAYYAGIRDSWIFDPATNTFTPTNLANNGHWYPTLTELGNGDIWMAGGLDESGNGTVATEYFKASTGQWLALNQVPQTWSFWGLYPHMFLMGDGRLFYSGGHVFGNGLPGSGASIYNWQTGAIADIPGLRQKDMRDQAASVLLPPAQNQTVLITGGGNINTTNPAINLTDIVDLNQASPTYVPGPDMPGMGKMYVNATTLPDRTVLTTNGAQLNRDASTNVNTAAIYHPDTNTWSTVPADPISRNYHSSAILLPNGQVAVLGSNPGDGSFELRISVYKPSYLYRGAQPTVSNVPAQATYGSSIGFNVATPSGKPIRWAQLIRPMSVTHQLDPNMRLVDLPFTIQNGQATATITPNSNLLPPGPYMLTVTDTDNVPSAAAWITIR